MLPEGFRWAPRWQYDTGDNALFLGAHMAAFLDQRVDGTWFARLELLGGGVTVLRDCTSRDRGRAGCEAWACRHEARLRREALQRDAQMPRRPWMPQKGGASS